VNEKLEYVASYVSLMQLRRSTEAGNTCQRGTDVGHTRKSLARSANPASEWSGPSRTDVRHNRGLVAISAVRGTRVRWKCRTPISGDHTSPGHIGRPRKRTCIIPHWCDPDIKHDRVERRGTNVWQPRQPDATSAIPQNRRGMTRGGNTWHRCMALTRVRRHGGGPRKRTRWSTLHQCLAQPHSRRHTGSASNVGEGEMQDADTWRPHKSVPFWRPQKGRRGQETNTRGDERRKG
jgi:hypothetical protein